MTNKKTREWCDLYVKEVINHYNPDFKIRPKSESKLFKFLSPIIKLVNPNFFTTFTTTFMGTMWVTDSFFDKHFKEALEVTAHEGRHEYDRKKMFPGAFELMYFFPQNLSLIFIALALLHSCWWLLPAALFLGPLPAPFRYKLEMNGYATSRIWNKYVYGIDEGFSDSNVVRTLSSLRTYYCTWPFKSLIYKDLDKPLPLRGDPGFVDIVEFLERHKLVIQ